MPYQHFDFIKQYLSRAQCPCIRKRDNDTLLINSHMKMMIVCRMRTRTTKWRRKKTQRQQRHTKEFYYVKNKIRCHRHNHEIRFNLFTFYSSVFIFVIASQKYINSVCDFISYYVYYEFSYRRRLKYAKAVCVFVMISLYLIRYCFEFEAPINVFVMFTEHRSSHIWLYILWENK